MDFCHPGWVSRTVSHNQSTQQHYQTLHPSETGKERAGTRYHSLSHQGGIHLVLLTHPGDAQNPAQEENQNSLSLQASPGKKQVSELSLPHRQGQYKYSLSSAQTGNPSSWNWVCLSHVKTLLSSFHFFWTFLAT